MNQKLVLFFLCSLPLFSFGQNTIDSLVSEGISLHDKGEYEKAIATYEKALLLDSLSGTVNYEIALSYMSLKEYEKAIIYVEKIPESDSRDMLQGIVLKGSALDMLGRSEESISFFEEMIEKGFEDYLLYYNLAITQLKLGKQEDSEMNLINALSFNINHASSHLILARLQSDKRNPVQALLATYYFLFLEPNTQRAIEAFQLMEENYGRNVEKDGKESTIKYSPDEESPFSPIELQISLLSLSSQLLDDVDLGVDIVIEKDEKKEFLNKTGSFFDAFKTVKKKKREEDIWWTFYVPFYESLAKSDHLETFCNYISMSVYEGSANWLEENESKLDEFSQWLQEEE